MSTPKHGTCAYCGDESDLTRDHIPPRALFPDEDPGDLLTVPCCEKCRGGWSQDDEYFRLMVMSSYLVVDNEVAQQVNRKVLRSLARPKAEGLRRLVRSSLGSIDLFTPGGLYLGQACGVKVDVKRFKRVSERILKALFFHEMKRLVPEGYTTVNIMQQLSGDYFDRHIKPISFAPLRSYAKGAFQYTFAQTETDPDSTMWIMLLYERLPFVGMTLKRGTPDEEGNRPTAVCSA
jgi:hypothetical protein